MNKPIISAIAAIGKNRELGQGGKLIWSIPEDMRHFKKITKGHPVIMGRKTYESIGRPLPNRTNIIITRNPDFKADGCIVASSIEDAIIKAKKHLMSRHSAAPRRMSGERNEPQASGVEGSPSLSEDQNEIFIIGGAQIYEQAMHLTDKLYLTIVDDVSGADAYFPDYKNYKLLKKDNIQTQSGYSISFHTYQR